MEVLSDISLAPEAKAQELDVEKLRKQLEASSSKMTPALVRSTDTLGFASQFLIEASGLFCVFTLDQFSQLFASLRAFSKLDFSSLDAKLQTKYLAIQLEYERVRTDLSERALADYMALKFTTRTTKKKLREKLQKLDMNFYAEEIKRIKALVQKIIELQGQIKFSLPPISKLLLVVGGIMTAVGLILSAFAFGIPAPFIMLPALSGAAALGCGAAGSVLTVSGMTTMINWMIGYKGPGQIDLKSECRTLI